MLGPRPAGTALNLLWSVGAGSTSGKKVPKFGFVSRKRKSALESDEFWHFYMTWMAQTRLWQAFWVKIPCLWAVARARMSQDERCFSSETLPSNWSETGFELLTSSN